MMSVVKVIAYSAKGRMSFGSGVVVSPEKVLTNCHVIFKAKRIILKKSGANYPVISQRIASELDLCLLRTEHLPLPAIDPGLLETLQTGDAVYAYGYPNGRGLSYRPGRIKNLHPYRDSKLLEIDIGIKQGASGGGLFNYDGQLVGITTFYRNDNGGKYFAVPLSWLEILLQKPEQAIAPFKGKPFWRQKLLLDD